ncbi:hypothetical protein DMC47_35130, partial [Nostoc sp. 3335mG]
MSVRMAIAKLCACACGGAVIGGGAVHYAERPPVNRVLTKKAPVRKPVYRQVAVRQAKRTVTTTTTCTPGTVTLAQAAPAAPFEAPSYGG